MRDTGDEKHQFRRFVARIGSAVPKKYACLAQRPCATFYGSADALSAAGALGAV
jgi:hypothetical protein